MTWALGNVLDVVPGVGAGALGSAAPAGKRIHMRNYQTLGVIFHKGGAASAGTDTVVLTLQEHTAASAGTSQNLARIDTYYYKSTASALAGTETWTEVTQAPAATISLANGGVIPAANAGIVYFDIEADALSAGYEWLSVTVSGLTSTNTIPATVLYVTTGLKIMARPDYLVNPNA